jgi:hypothetical protein
MSLNGGFFLIIDQSRSNVIKKRIKAKEAFSDAINADGWGGQDYELCILGTNADSFSCLALCKKGNLVATRKSNIKFFDYVIFELPIKSSEIFEFSAPDFDQNSLMSAGLVTWVDIDSWQKIINYIKYLRPESASDIDQLIASRNTNRIESDENAQQILIFERDAVNISLRIAGIDEKSITKWNSTRNARVAPFLSGLNGPIFREDQMIIQDARVFGDWNLIENHMIGSAVFENQNSKLTILNANRHRLEETLGVDLIYYFHEFRSYLMIQYKRMAFQSGGFAYRPNDNSYTTEMESMNYIDSILPYSDFSTPDPWDYRLNSKLFFFKLCASLPQNPLSTSMIEGLYIPLDYWKLIVNSEHVKGPKGGISVSKSNVLRHLNNTLFIDLAKSGWIGTQQVSQDTISELIRLSLDNHHSVLLAHKRK